MEPVFEEELVNEFTHEEENQEMDNEEGEDLEEREKEDEEMEVEKNEPLEQEEDKEEVQQEEEQMQEKPVEPENMEKEDIDEEMSATKEEEEVQPPEEQNEVNEIIGDSSENIKEEKQEEETETKEPPKEEEGQGKESAMKYETVDPKTESADTTQVKSSYTNEIKTEEKQSTTITKTAPPSTTDKKEKSTKKSKLLYGCDYMRTTLSCLEVNLPKYINKIVKLAKPKEKTVEDTATTPIEPFEKTKEITKITSENIPLVYPILKKKHVPVILSKKASAVDEETYNMYTKDNPDYKPYIVPIEVYVPRYLNPDVGYEYMNYEIKDKEIDMEVKTKLLEQLNPHLMFYDYYKCDPYRILSDYYNLASLLFQGKAIMKYPKEEPQPARHIKSTRVFYRRIKIVKKKVAV